MRFLITEWSLILSSLLLFTFVVFSHDIVPSELSPIALDVGMVVAAWVIGVVSAATIHVLYRQSEHIMRQAALEQLQEEYVATVSHDLRNPITSVMGFAQMLESQLTKMGMATQAKRAGMILINARRMDSMIQELVESAALESGKLSLAKESADLNALVSGIAERVGSPEDRQRLRVDTTRWTGPLSLDSPHFERVLVNLITNALKYSPPDSPVLVRVERLGKEAMISVVDQGMGIPPEDLPHLFERFFRANKALKSEGLGLGLYITRLIVEAHGGRVWAESTEGKGSTFSFVLPATLE